MDVILLIHFPALLDYLNIQLLCPTVDVKLTQAPGPDLNQRAPPYQPNLDVKSLIGWIWTQKLGDWQQQRNGG